MANPEHVKILEQGVEVWNKWRQLNPEAMPDLETTDLCGWNLVSANLCNVNLARTRLLLANLNGANLTSADLTGANLTKTNLMGSILVGVDLVSANLSEANLRWANLAGADLRWADLTVTDLTGANLTRANLADANLEKATIFEAIFGDIDLSKTIGLDNLDFTGPSVIDHRTLMQSKNLPEKFLQDCGLPDQLIDNLPSLLNSIEPIQFHSCFISYSSKDEEFARRLHADLQDKGIRCWYAPEDMKIGDKIRPRIDEVIHLHEKLLLVLSEDSIKSNWVEKEVETAFEKESDREENVLFPIRLDETVMDIKTGWPADIKRTRNIGDFKNWKNHDAYQKSFERLLRDLKNESG